MRLLWTVAELHHMPRLANPVKENISLPIVGVGGFLCGSKADGTFASERPSRPVQATAELVNESAGFL